MRNPIKDLKGLKFGRWLVKKFAELRPKRGAFWLCICECGIEKIISGKSLCQDISKSCGCLRREVTKKRNLENNPSIVKHGMTGTPEWAAYKDARRRCTKPNNSRYIDYGGRGIKFLFTNFEQFFAELGRRPKGKTLDRINNDGNYEPGNVRWATTHEQRINQRIRA